MKIIILENAEKDLEKIEEPLYTQFFNHFKKCASMPPRRHLHYGIPYSVENVTKQSRFVYEIRDDSLFVVRCFANHKEYEKWYQAFR